MQMNFTTKNETHEMMMLGENAEGVVTLNSEVRNGSKFLLKAGIPFVSLVCLVCLVVTSYCMSPV